MLDFPQSIDVVNGNNAKASEYNKLRDDALSFFRGGDGSDGVLNGTQSIDCTSASNGILVLQYSSINVESGQTITLSNVPSSGVTIVMLCQGDCTIAGTIDFSGGGTQGVSGVSVSRTSNGGNATDGTDGTDVDTALRFGQTRKAAGGNSDSRSLGSSVAATASGASSGANPASDGNDSTDATFSSSTSVGVTGGKTITASLLNILSTFYGIRLFAGAGGAVGGVSIYTNGYSSGTLSATSGDAGDGGASLCIFVGGDFSFTGTINLSGTSATASSVALCTISGTNVGQAAAAGGSSAGSSGCFLGMVRGSITNSGTFTLNKGTKGAKASNQQGFGGGSGSGATSTDAGEALDGTAVVCPMP